MDNDAFKALVRSKVKSTKDIAREAVEEAFQHKRKRNQKRNKRGNQRKKGRNDDYDDDDDDQDNYSSSESEPEDRRPKRGDGKDDNGDEREDDIDGELNDDSHQFMPSAVRKKKQPRYRDRAKERREGKNDDYKDSQNLLQKVTGQDNDNHRGSAVNAEGAEDTAMDQAELSKYLGGDEAHTHLVKGLDVALARSVRKEMEPVNQQREEGDESDDGDENRLALEDLKPIQTTKEAWSILRQHASANDDASRSADLKKQSILNYYLQTHPRRKQKQKAEASATKNTCVAVSSAGSALQRTQLVFAVDWHPTNLARSWEVPVEKSQAAASLQPSALSKVSPLPSELILAMQEKQNRKWHAVVTATASTGKPQDSNVVTALGGGKFGTTTGNRDTVEEDEDSEDDIFPDAGDDSS